MRISDWSSDVCSSDLIGNRGRQIYKGGVNVPIGDHAAARIFGGWGKFDGTIKNERTGNYIGGYDGNYAYGINVLVEPTDRLQINLFGMYSRVNNRAVPLRQRPTSENNCGSETVWNGTTFNTLRSEEHTSELQSLMRISYAVFCLKK